MGIFAYLDAGTGSLFIQALIGAALASGIVLRSVIRKTFLKFKPGNARNDSIDEEI